MRHSRKLLMVSLVGLLACPLASQAQALPFTYLFSKAVSILSSIGNDSEALEYQRKHALTAEEIERGIPEESLRAMMSPPRGKLITMDGHSMRLAPAAKIRDSKNRIVIPGRIQRDVEVRFVSDRNGDVRTVWLITEDYYKKEKVASRGSNSGGDTRNSVTR